MILSIPLTLLEGYLMQQFSHREDVYVSEVNWFEYIYKDTVNGDTYSDGVMMENDLSLYSEEDLKNEMLAVVDWIVNG
jgi:hypothetical protein